MLIYKNIMDAELTNQLLKLLLKQQLEKEDGKKTLAVVSINDLHPDNSYKDFYDDFDFIDTNYVLQSKLHIFLAKHIIKNLDKYDEKDRPILMPNTKTKVLYYYEDGEWNKDEDNQKLAMLVRRITAHHIKLLQERYQDDTRDTERLKKIIALCSIDDYGSMNILVDKIVSQLTNSLKLKTFSVNPREYN